ncbi:DUF4062 domain-containing protein [uncultured Abyssibacter sp.]|mgnify:CR=1 FL=1|uniref:DUF4062 domain-containing protein n=1 Tax=uncultured Abyssibacter sp. TaxID=2320202 RepID=UPI0032B15D08
MAKPRVFVSSTYYDLKHLRSSLENFIEALGYEPVLSEKDDIAYLPDAPLDESCYREARNSDIYVLIVGGRYGSKTSAGGKNKGSTEGFYERYESITKQEYVSACERNIPVYVLIESSVDSEYQTWLRNRGKKDVKYAHVDSVNIFHFIEHIRDQQKNNPVKSFSRYAEIESYLREQWAGFFRELIHRMSAQHQIEDLDAKINSLSETSETLKRYMEEVVSQVSQEKRAASEIIREENERLRQAKLDAEFTSIGYIGHLKRAHEMGVDHLRESLRSAKDYEAFVLGLFVEISEIPMCTLSSKAFAELNEAREQLEKAAFPREQLYAYREKYETRLSEESKPKKRSTRKVTPKKSPAKKTQARKPPQKRDSN